MNNATLDNKSSLEPLIRLMDARVIAIEFDLVLATALFEDLTEYQFRPIWPPSLLLLAVLANNETRGIRHGLSEALEYLKSCTKIRRISIQRNTKEFIVLQFDADGQVASFHLLRPLSQIPSPYELSEFTSIENLPFRVRSPGRALAPLSALTFKQQARKIVDCLLKGDRQALFSIVPMMVVLGLSDNCNHACTFCFRHTNPDYHRAPHSIYDESSLTSILLSASKLGVQAVRFSGEGEDTLNPNYLKILLLSRAIGLNVLQITNGTRNLELAPIIARTVDFLRVSINGWTPTNYASKHGLDSYDALNKTISGVRRIVDERTKVSSHRIAVCISSVIGQKDLESFRPMDLKEVIKGCAADIALLKYDGECSRYLNIQPNIQPWRMHTDGQHVISEVPEGFISLRTACAAICPEVVSETKSHNNYEPVRNWIEELRLGCILRYVRAEVERGFLYSCSVRHDCYGALSDGFSEVWDSTARKSFLADDLRRHLLICEGCGWRDFFSLFNCFIDEAIREANAPFDMNMWG